VDDEQVLGRIEELVAEEHRLLHQGETQQGLGPDDHARLGEVKVQLDHSFLSVWRWFSPSTCWG